MVFGLRAERIVNAGSGGALVPPVGEASRLELTVDLRTIALEFAAHPQCLLVVPDAAGEIGSDKCAVRGANCTVVDQDVFVGNRARADIENAAVLSVNYGPLFATIGLKHAIDRQCRFGALRYGRSVDLSINAWSSGANAVSSKTASELVKW
jgi:hypothetical protein